MENYGFGLGKHYVPVYIPTSQELLNPVCNVTGLPYGVVKNMTMGDRVKAIEECLGINFIKNTRIKDLRRYGINLKPNF